jgi:hypothetical protein
MLVAAASALFLLMPVQLGMDDEATSRVLQGLLAGVGFLCAGAILKLPEAERGARPDHGRRRLDDGSHRRRRRPGARDDGGVRARCWCWRSSCSKDRCAA